MYFKATESPVSSFFVTFLDQWHFLVIVMDSVTEQFKKISDIMLQIVWKSLSPLEMMGKEKTHYKLRTA